MQNSTLTVAVAAGAEYDAQIEDTARGGDGIARVEGFVSLRARNRGRGSGKALGRSCHATGCCRP